MADNRETRVELPDSLPPLDRSKMVGRFVCADCKAPASLMDILAAMEMQIEYDPKTFLCDQCRERRVRIYAAVMSLVKTVSMMQYVPLSTNAKSPD